jgi:hypothetical protein
MTKDKKSVQLYYDYIETLEELNDKQFRAIITSMVDYDINGTTPNLDEVSKMAFKFIKKRIDYDHLSYDEKCKKKQGKHKQILGRTKE